MSRPIIISTVTGVLDNKPKRVETGWEDINRACMEPSPRGALCLADYLAAEKSVRDAQKDGKGIIPGEFTKPGTRGKSDLKARHFLVLDLDDSFYTFEQLTKALKGFECIIHTSYSHSEGRGKYRVFILFDAPVTEDIAGTCGRMLDYFSTILGKHIDDKCWTPNQLYFTPSCPPDAVHLYRHQHLSGEPLKVADFWTAAPDEQQIKSARKATGNRPGDDYNRKGSWKELLEGEGWTHYINSWGCEYWTRPGKSKGISGVVFYESNIFYCHTSASEAFPFEAGKAYSLFVAYALTNHGGDYTAAARQLAAEGYGDQQENRQQGKQSLGDEKAIGKRRVNPYEAATMSGDMAKRDIKIEYVVEGLIPKDFITLFYAPSGMGKSTLSTQLAQGIQDGTPVLGLRTQQAEVFYLDFENPDATIVERLRKVSGGAL